MSLCFQKFTKTYTWAEDGKCINLNKDCKSTHPPKCRSSFTQGVCRRPNCGYVHPTNINIRSQHSHSEYKPQPQYQRHEFRMDQDREDFQKNYPLPEEASMSLHQYLAKIMEKQEKMYTRMDWIMKRIESSRM